MKIESIDTMTDEKKNKSYSSNKKEKYNLEYTNEELLETTSKVQLSKIAKTSLYDMLKEFIIPLSISLGIVMVYFCN